MRFHLISIDSTADMDRYRPVIVQALTEIGQRSGGRYPAEAVYDRLRNHWVGQDGFALWLGIDRDKLESRQPPMDCVAGMTTLTVLHDELGQNIAFISRGWIREGYQGQPFDYTLPYIEQWAKRHGCVKIVSSTERSSAASMAKRWERKYLMDRLSGLAAYWKWIGKRGFVMRETIFEKEVTP